MNKNKKQIVYFFLSILFIAAYLFIDMWNVFSYRNNPFGYGVFKYHILESAIPLILGMFFRRDKIFSLFTKGKLRFSWADAILALLPWCLIYNRYIWGFGGARYIGLLFGYFAAGIVSKGFDEA